LPSKRKYLAEEETEERKNFLFMKRIRLGFCNILTSAIPELKPGRYDPRMNNRLPTPLQNVDVR